MPSNHRRIWLILNGSKEHFTAQCVFTPSNVHILATPLYWLNIDNLEVTDLPSGSCIAGLYGGNLTHKPIFQSIQ
jgi:hypothetical protein